MDRKKEYELDYCNKCVQMTNHLNGVCQKCSKQDEKESISGIYTIK